jgi:hypothetical protein
MARLGHVGFSTSSMLYEGQTSELPKAMAFRLFAMVIPPTIGAAIALTRILDNRHHWLDVIFGFGLGAFLSLFASRAYLRRHYESVPPSVNDIELPSVVDSRNPATFPTRHHSLKRGDSRNNHVSHTSAPLHTN